MLNDERNLSSSKCGVTIVLKDLFRLVEETEIAVLVPAFSPNLT